MINRIAETLPKVKQNSDRTKEREGLFAGIDLQEMIQPVEQLIVKNSGLAMVVAFALGVTIACLVKRR